MNTQPYEILTGVGDLYIAPLGTTMPAVDAVPGAAFRHLGYTQDGVTVKKTNKIEPLKVDQETGPVKATRTEEVMTIETSLAEMTEENLADYTGNNVTMTPPASGVAGIKTIGLYSGADVKESCFLFRGKSAYGDYPSQFWIPRGYIDGDAELKFTKNGNPAIKIAITALVDPDAVSDAEKFGKLVMQNAEAGA